MENNIVSREEFNVYNIIRRLWVNRLVFVLIISVFSVASIIYSLVVDHEYEVSATLHPADASAETTIKDTRSVMGFAMTGYSHMPVMNDIMITLRSNSFLERVYENFRDDEDVFGDSLKEIDDNNDHDHAERLRRHSALRFLRKAVRFSINSDHNTIVLFVRLKNKYAAYEVMEFIISDLRDYIRTNNISNVESDIVFYQEIVDKADDPRIQRVIERKLTEKFERKFVLSSNVFTVVDRPVIPAKRVFPKRSMIVILTTIAGTFFSFLVITLYPTVQKLYKIIRDNNP